MSSPWSRIHQDVIHIRSDTTGRRQNQVEYVKMPSTWYLIHQDVINLRSEYVKDDVNMGSDTSRWHQNDAGCVTMPDGSRSSMRV